MKTKGTSLHHTTIWGAGPQAPYVPDIFTEDLNSVTFEACIDYNTLAVGNWERLSYCLYEAWYWFCHLSA